MKQTILMQKLISFFLAFCILLGNSSSPAYAQDSTGSKLFLPLIQRSTTTDGLAELPESAIFRTSVTIPTSSQWHDLDEMAVIILQRGNDWAQLLVDDVQLEVLARLRYTPIDTNALSTLAQHDISTAAWSRQTIAQVTVLLQKANELAKQLPANVNGAGLDGTAQSAVVLRTEVRTLMRQLDEDALHTLANAESVDSDHDGLTDTQENYWCTNSNNPDSDYDKVSDGDEVTAIKAWMNNQRSTPPSTAQPFNGWPTDNPGCLDNDRDSIPNLAELYELGLNMNRESTDRDKFDDGQEVFGVTYCPGSGTACGYGSQPPASHDGIVLFPEMPSWVKSPGNHPLVAAFPVPDINVVESSLHVQTVTVVTAGHEISSGTEKTYSTSKTEGTSTSVANTVTWNEWQEVSESLSERIGAVSSAEITSPNARDWWKVAGGVSQIAAGVGTAALGCGAEGFAAVTTFGIGALAAWPLCGAGIMTGASFIGQGMATVGDSYIPDVAQTQTYINTYNSTTNNTQINQNETYLLGQIYDQSNRTTMYQGTQYLNQQNNELLNRRLYALESALVAPVHTTTNSKGKSWGGAQTTTTEQYEEHTVTNGEAFSDSEGWSDATAVDSAHSADLWFTFTVRNSGTEYAKEIKHLAFNIYIGDDPNPACTYFFGTNQCGVVAGDAVQFANFMPNEEKTFTSGRIPLTLNQMKVIDLGEPIRIVVEDFTYGIDEIFYQDAVHAGVMVAIEDGTDDGNEMIDTYLIPTWTAGETTLQVLQRYFPHKTDAEGNLISISTPEYRSDNPSWCHDYQRPTDYPNKAVWCKHDLSTTDWWNIYTDGLGNGSEGFQDTMVTPGSTALFRFNKDSDLDSFSDRSEHQMGTDPNDAASYPKPELLAGLHSIRTGNQVTATLSLLNRGIYDAYGVEAVMIAPNDSISITNNTVGGSGRVRALNQVIVGSRTQLQALTATPWVQEGHAQPSVGGYYTGQADRSYTFTVSCGLTGGCRVGSDSWNLHWLDSKGITGTLAFGSGYQSPTFQRVGNLGVTLALYSGKVNNGESFVVAATTPRDTFQYTVNREPFTPPIVIVSYNDPQGNHRFVVPSQAMSLTMPTVNLQVFADSMLQDVGVEIITTAPFTPTVNNTLQLLVNNPTTSTIANGHLFLELINISGTVVAEVPTTADLPPGPSYTPVAFNSNAFDLPYESDKDYIVLAFLTDYQGNVLDTAGRPLSSFQIDPRPALSVSDGALTWDFGTATQGMLLKHTLSLANTGFGKLYTFLNPINGLTLNSRSSQSIGAADTPVYEVTLHTEGLPSGAYERTIHLATSDPLRPSLPLHVTGVITTPPVDISTSMTQRPLDVALIVTGTHSAGEWMQFPHNLGIEPQSLHPIYVFNDTSTTLMGTGKYATDFAQNTTSAENFGDGRDGIMPTSGNLDNNNGFGIGVVNSGSIGSNQINVSDAYGVWRINPGDAVLIHQTQGNSAGCWEINRAVSDFTTTTTGNYQMANPLKCNYISGSAQNHAQIVRVPQYATCNVTGEVTPLAVWNGTWGGIFAIMCNNVLNLTGTIKATGFGFRGVSHGAIYRNQTGYQGEGSTGFGTQTNASNSNGGGGGQGGQDGGGGAGGGNGSSGGNGGNSPVNGRLGGAGGAISGDAELSTLVFGGAGGEGGSDEDGGNPGNGGNGGGIIAIFARSIQNSGKIVSNGNSGGNACQSCGGGGGWGMAGGGGGAGGSIFVRANQIVNGTTVEAIGGGGGSSHPSHGVWGGAGGVGRIRFEYCSTSSGSANPIPSVVKVSCSIVEQVETSPTNARLNLPETFSNGRTYIVQFGRRLNFSVASSQVTSLTVPSGLYQLVQFDALVSGLPANATLSLDVGNNGSVEWSNAVVNSSKNENLNLTEAFAAYWRTQNSPVNGTIDVPVKVTLSQPGQVLLTDLSVQTTAHRLRYIRLPVQNYSKVDLDFTIGSTGSNTLTVAMDIGDNGSIDWVESVTSADLPYRFVNRDITVAVNRYLAIHTGETDIPIRFFVSPDLPITLNNYNSTAIQSIDLVASQIQVHSGVAVAASAATTITVNEGDLVKVQTMVRNSGNQPSGPVSAAFFANTPGWGDWYIGSAYLSNLSAGDSQEVSVDWTSTGFAGVTPIKVVINPYHRISETIYSNNTISTTVQVNSLIQGDLNGDNFVNIFDLQRQITMILNLTPLDPNLYPLEQWYRGDLDGNELWNIFDLQRLIRLIQMQ